jgi:hypothetical protein
MNKIAEEHRMDQKTEELRGETKECVFIGCRVYSSVKADLTFLNEWSEGGGGGVAG